MVRKALEPASSADSHRTAPQSRSLTQGRKKRPLKLVHEIESAGGGALALKANSASAEELRAAVTKTAETLGPLDIFVSNAGILTRGTIDTYSLEDFDRMVAINFRAAFIGVQAAAHPEAYLALQRQSRQNRKSMNEIAAAVIMSDDVRRSIQTN